jgi:hypothetical protein
MFSAHSTFWSEDLPSTSLHTPVPHQAATNLRFFTDGLDLGGVIYPAPETGPVVEGATFESVSGIVTESGMRFMVVGRAPDGVRLHQDKNARIDSDLGVFRVLLVAGTAVPKGYGTPALVEPTGPNEDKVGCSSTSKLTPEQLRCDDLVPSRPQRALTPGPTSAVRPGMTTRWHTSRWTRVCLRS